jgi:hypothetical protein
VASYPPFTVGGGAYDDATIADGGLAGPRDQQPLEQNGRNDMTDTGTALFGNPLPDSPADLEQQGSGYQSYGAGRASSTQSGEADLNVDAPTERLPIYEAVLSQWFEAADTGSAPPRGGDAEAATNGNGNGHAKAGTGTNGNSHAAVQEAPSAEPTPWTSPGDDGWLAAQALLEDKTPDTTTNAGLPKRVPKAHLVPGSAAPRHEAKETTGEAPAAPPLPPRSADAVRGRMSSFQQGVRRGRHALIDAYAGDQSGSEQSRQDEEQE